MKISSAEFLISNTDYKKCPNDNVPDFAFIGRSNVGKSSLINMLCNHKNLAKTSARPGKTQLINHFSINSKQWYLVDLPGYGYARTSKTNREKWEGMIVNYLCKRENLYCVFVLIDSRLEPQKIDLEFIDWLGEKELPFVLAFTKTDKISAVQVDKHIAAFKRELEKSWDEIPPIFKTSAVENKGKTEILEFIEKTLS
jgi:GTP-binding protein